MADGVHLYHPELRQGPELAELLAGWKPGKTASLGPPTPNLPATVAEVDGRLVGFLTGHHRFRHWEALPDHRGLAGSHGSWLAELFVHPAHRRAGVGAALVSHFIDESVAAGASMVVVRPDASDSGVEQTARQCFFLAQGFVVLRLDPDVRFLPEWLMGRPNDHG
ncbi:hypothetical protein BKD30_11610 [Tersicoccus phoenicis]|uniref:N-acetyltransferase domain-containing protein n=1 Tax=Tersicoccus phoenicis TaxID=554083 RepID=A0A1R1L7N8_9MICC|nr:GNAT family N-acetyltransferase [Tersicoccus phoenicis]OMH23561.1 hypothetical protein BKD30_11610 [Tersicoccus phoenicis]